MAQNIATLAVKFIADTFGLKTGMNKAAKDIGLMQRAGNAATSAVGSQGGLAGALAGLGPAGVAAGAALIGVASAAVAAYKGIEQFNASARRIDATSKLATRLDLTYGSLQRLTFLAGDSGIPIESLAKAMEHMGRTIGSGGMSLEDRFTQQAKAISKIHDPAMRAKEAYRVFGKEAGAMLPLLVDIGKNAERFDRYADSFGFTISDTDSRNVERMNSAWGDLVFIGTQLADKFVSKFGGPVADFLESGIVMLEDWAKAFEDSGVRWEDIGHIANNAMKTMTWMVATLNNELKTTFYLLGQLSRFSKLIGSVNPLAARMLSQSNSSPQDFATRGGGFDFSGGGFGGKAELPAALERGSAGAISAVLEAGGNPLATVAQNTKDMLESLREIYEELRDKKGNRIEPRIVLAPTGAI